MTIVDLVNDQLNQPYLAIKLLSSSLILSGLSLAEVDTAFAFVVVLLSFKSMSTKRSSEWIGPENSETKLIF